MKISHSCAILACSGLLAFGFANADEHARAYAGLALGQSQYAFSKNDIPVPGDPVSIPETSSSENRTTFNSRDTGFRLYGGFRMTPYLAVEGGYVGLGRIGLRRSVDSICTPPQPLCTPRTFTQSGNVKAGGWTLSLVGELPIGHSFALSARAGLIRSTVRISNNVSERFFSDQPATATQTRPIVGIGVRYALSSQISARLNWERFINLGDRGHGDRGQTGNGNVDLVSLGLEYSF